MTAIIFPSRSRFARGKPDFRFPWDFLSRDVEIDFSNPLTEGLVSYWLPRPNVNPAHDFLLGDDAWTLGATYILGNDEDGFYLEYTNSGQINLSLPSSKYHSEKEFSIAYAGKWYAATDYGFRYPPSATNGIGDQRYRIGYAGYGGDNNWKLEDAHYFSVFPNQTPLGQTNFTRKVIVGVIDEASSRVAAAVNGQYASGSPTSIHTSTIKDYSLGINRRGIRSYCFAAWNRPLSDIESVSFSVNPLQVLKFVSKRRLLISVPAGGGSPLAANDPAAQSDADTAAISQTHGNLAASDAEGAADADTAAATQDHALAGTDIEAGADADTGAVDQAGTVAADEAEALADADTAAASQDHQLAGDDIEAQAAPDTGAVDQAGTLAVDDAEALADADTAAASQDHELAGADIEAQADPDTGAAQQAGVLTADPAEATADADTAAATQDHDLAGADIEARADADTGAVDGSATTAADDIEARADADTGAVTVIHKPAAADAEGQAAMDAAAAGQVHELGADDAEARGDIPAGGLLLDGIGVVFSPQLLDVTLRTYLIDPHNPTGAPR